MLLDDATTKQHKASSSSSTTTTTTTMHVAAANGRADIVKNKFVMFYFYSQTHESKRCAHYCCRRSSCNRNKVQVVKHLFISLLKVLSSLFQYTYVCWIFLTKGGHWSCVELLIAAGASAVTLHNLLFCLSCCCCCCCSFQLNCLICVIVVGSKRCRLYANSCRIDNCKIFRWSVSNLTFRNWFYKGCCWFARCRCWWCRQWLA